MINIKTPCSENWDGFKPTEKGAFCGKCQIDVIDFSVKSNEELLTFFKSNTGNKMCGRFKQSQIDNFNLSFYDWKGQSTRTFQAKFILTLLLVFGLTLFSCKTMEDTQQIEITIEQSQIEIASITQTNSSQKSSKTGVDYKIENDNAIDKNITTPLQKIELNPNPAIFNTILVEKLNIMEIMVYGTFIPSDEYDYIEPKTSLSLLPINQILPTTPNQSSKIIVNQFGKSTLIVDSKYSEKYIINIYTKKGHLIQYVVNQELTSGENFIDLDFENYPSDDYFIVITSEGNHAIIKHSL